MEKQLKKMNIELYHYENLEKINGINKKMCGDCISLRGDCTLLSGDCAGLRGDCTGLIGDCTGLNGDCTGLRGDCTGLIGDCTGLIGDLNLCKITHEERQVGVKIDDLVMEVKAI